jgi:hypothetical protein
MATKRASQEPTPEAELRSCIGRLAPRTQKLFRAVRAAVRKRFPTANELAYDYGDALVVGYAPAEHGIDAVVAIDARGDGVRLILNQGPALPDPKKLLLGKGKQTRFIPLEAVSRLAHPDVKALLAAAVARAKVPLPATGKGALIIKATAAKKRTRPKPSK